MIAPVAILQHFLDGLIGNVSISESVLFTGNNNWPIPNICNKIQQCDLGRSDFFRLENGKQRIFFNYFQGIGACKLHGIWDTHY